MDIIELFKEAARRGASDIHLKVGKPPYLRLSGQLQPLEGHPPLTQKQLMTAFDTIARARHKDRLRRERVADFSVAIEDFGRYRVNAYYQMGTLAMAIRLISPRVRSVEELNLPPQLNRLALEDRGLILVTGVAGTGKSTTLAAMLDYINHHKAVTIITIEDPIEYVLTEDKALISQREVGEDTLSFLSGLKEALRQDPNVIMVGEMRDLETIATALIAAETGHLVFSTLHTMDAKETLNRIISVFPAVQQDQVRVQLASVLKAVISQRLVPRADGRGLVPAVEIMVVTARIRELIRDPEKTLEIPQAIAEGVVPYGMQTFDQSLYYLWRRGLITQETALEHANQPEVLAMRMQGISRGVDGGMWGYFDALAEEAKRRERAQNSAQPSPTPPASGPEGT